jgi:RHS repeat-associated protein
MRLQTSFTTRTVNIDQAFAPYGEVYNKIGGNGPLNFTGDLQDIFAGLYDTPNRELMSNAGRWLSPDPAGASWNAYSYPTNPNSVTDPSGLNPKDDIDDPDDDSAPYDASWFGLDAVVDDATGASISEVFTTIFSGGGAMPTLDMTLTFTGSGSDNTGSDNTSSTEPTFAGGFLAEGAASDAAWGLVSGTFNAPQAAATQGICGHQGGICGAAVGAGIGMISGTAQGLLMHAGAGLVELGLNDIFYDSSYLSTTRGVFTAIDGPPNRPPDLVSKPNLNRAGEPIVSMYWKVEGGMIRQSNHWGPMTGANWSLMRPNGEWIAPPTAFKMFENTENMPTGFISWSDLSPNF